MQKLLNFCFEMEFYLKIAISCTIAQQLFFLLLNKLKLNFIKELLVDGKINKRTSINNKFRSC